MVCEYVQEGNPPALASGSSSVHTHNHSITALLHQHACVLSAEILHSEIFDVEHWNTTQRCNKTI